MKPFLLSLALIFIIISANAQTPGNITLNPPDTSRGLPVMQAMQLRASASAFSSEPLSMQDLSDIIWAANGINRPESGRRTAPSARNSQDIDVYVIMESGAYFYNHKTHVLELVATGDHRGLVTGRQASMANAPVMLLLVSDISRFQGSDNDLKLRWGAMDAGIVSQNIAVACAGLGMVTRPRASMDVAGLRQLLKLTDTQHPMLNNPVGYPAK